MELADLVRAQLRRAPSSVRLAARFFVLGALLFGGVRLAGVELAPARDLVVHVPEGATPREVDAAVDEAILLDLAVRAGFAHDDPVVRGRILTALAAARDEATDPEATVRRGIALGLPAQDPVARARLVSLATRALAASSKARPDADDIARELGDHEPSYARPSRVRFEQLFLAAQARGPALEADARAAEGWLRDHPDPSDAELAARGDPWPWTSPRATESVARLEALLGPDTGAAIAEAPAGAWSGPIRSSFGVHFVRVLERRDAAASPSDAVPRAAIAAAREVRTASVRRALARLRSKYHLILVRSR